MKAQIKNILEFFKSDKTRKDALSIILNLTESPDALTAFRDTEIIRLLLRLLDSEKLTPEESLECYYCLINFSSRKEFCTQFYSFNACVRLAKLFLAQTDKEFVIKPINDDNMFSLELDIGLLGSGIIFQKEKKEDGQTLDIKQSKTN